MGPQAGQSLTEHMLLRRPGRACPTRARRPILRRRARAFFFSRAREEALRARRLWPIMSGDLNSAHSAKCVFCSW